MIKHLIKINKIKFFIFLIIFGLYSCQKIEVLDKVAFNYDQLPTITISAEKKEFKNLYESKLNEPYIDHSMINPPINFLNEWFSNNINTIGTQNNFQINIIEASLKKTEIPNTDSKKYKEKFIFLYEINFLVEFILYDDSNSMIGNSIVEAKSTTTSSRYISLHESEKIIDTLIINCLSDFSKKAQELINIHMKKYIL
mgnify:CR=1 FL=1|tara:strand:- start:589 stop:1182 length:594 start_codon:yes stop_codon:yes gene_type:complete